jgi:hypothetical protein
MRQFSRRFSRSGEFFQNTYIGFFRGFLICSDRESSFSSRNQGIFGKDFFPSVFPDSPNFAAGSFSFFVMIISSQDI